MEDSGISFDNIVEGMERDPRQLFHAIMIENYGRDVSDDMFNHFYPNIKIKDSSSPMLNIPGTVSEVNVQAEFYRQCKEAGLNIYLQYRYDGCIFDAIIYSDGEIKFIVEIKSSGPSRIPGNGKSRISATVARQIKRYASYDIPVLLIASLEFIPEATNYMIKQLRELKEENWPGWFDNI